MESRVGPGKETCLQSALLEFIGFDFGLDSIVDSSKVFVIAPIRSAAMPANGCVNPHQSWPNANAGLTLARPSPVDVLSVPTNNPID